MVNALYQNRGDSVPVPRLRQVSLELKSLCFVHFNGSLALPYVRFRGKQTTIKKIVHLFLKLNFCIS